MSAPPAYAPTGTSSYTPSENTRISFHEEVTKDSLLPTSIHKSVYDSVCEIYSIVTAMQLVENAYVKDYVSDKEKYTSTVMRLVNQYQMLVGGLKNSPTHEQVLQQILPGIASDHSDLLAVLVQKFNLHAPLAVDRLTKGFPATIEHMGAKVESQSKAPKGSAASARLVAEATGNFITLMDALKLNYNTKAQLHPLLSNLVISLNDLVTSENEQAVEFPAKSKLVSWLIKLNNSSDSEPLSAEECESFLQDLDSAYKGFYDSLE